MAESDLIDLLGAFADAWNRHDVDAIVSIMTDDCVYQSSGGSEAWGTRFSGRAEVRAGCLAALRDYPDAQWRNATHFVAGDRGLSHWTFTGTRGDGMRIEVDGCDVFTFRDGKIAVKDSYRKNRPLLPAGLAR